MNSITLPEICVNKELWEVGETTQEVLCASSLDVAKHLGKPHNDLLKACRRFTRPQDEKEDDQAYAVRSKIALGNFSQSSYLNEQGKPQPMIYMTEIGLVALLGSLSGLKVEFIRNLYVLEFERLRKEEKNLLVRLRREGAGFGAWVLMAVRMYCNWYGMPLPRHIDGPLALHLREVPRLGELKAEKIDMILDEDRQEESD